MGIAIGVQDTTRLFLNNGIGQQALLKISEKSGNIETLISRWRKMMETFLSVQVHVIAGLGYPANDKGLALYNQHLAKLIQESPPKDIESLRVTGCELWKSVLMSAFNVSQLDITKNSKSIAEARSIMHQVSMRMIDPKVIDLVAQKCQSLNMKESKDKDLKGIEKRHGVIQNVLVNHVYLGESSLVESCGFGEGEKGYILLQSVMAEHQQDPLISQYLGSGMFRLFQAAGIDMGNIKQSAKTS